MGRDVPFDPIDKCDLCGKYGAYDFMGDYICDDCLDGKRTEEQGESLASAIAKISDGFDALLKSGLNKRAIVLLLHDATRLRRTDIQAVLDALPKLKEMYCQHVQ